MKLNTTLKSEIDKIKKIGAVLDIGFGYPYELIELFHICKAYKCFGVDLKEEKSVASSSRSLVTNEISENSIIKIDRNKIRDLIKDSDSKREFHNSYKFYTSLVLNKEPIDFKHFKRNIQLHFSTSIQEYLKKINQGIYYDVIIASKVLSHIDPNSEENSNWVLDRLLEKLSDKGVIYLKLNSDDFNFSNSTILDPFDEKSLKNVLERLDVISLKTIMSLDKKREFEVIAKKR